jgi:hypothetical protein
MDDFVLLVENKNAAIKLYNDIRDFLKTELNLSLNDKSRYYPSSMGVNFCGYRVFETHRLIRNGSKKKIRKKVKLWNKLYEKEKLDTLSLTLSFNSWLGHIKHSNSYMLKGKVVETIKYFNDKHT